MRTKKITATCQHTENCPKVIEVINKIKILCGTGVSVQRSPACRPLLLTDRRTDRRQLTTTVGDSRPIIVLGALGPHIFF